MKKFRLKRIATLYVDSTSSNNCGKLENTYIQVPKGKTVYGKIVNKIDGSIGSPNPIKFIQLGGMEDDLIGKYIYASEVIEEPVLATNKHSNIGGDVKINNNDNSEKIDSLDSKIRVINAFRITIPLATGAIGFLIGHSMEMGREKNKSLALMGIGLLIGSFISLGLRPLKNRYEFKKMELEYEHNKE